ncbi:MAG TPA: DinB family protein [Nocardioidaceae bacterium]|jgi:uncharacterized damage-inducible protein DinB
MSTISDVLTDAFGRIRESVHEAVEGLDGEQLCYRPDAEANSVAWLVWHLTRVQDDHVSDVAGREQVWTAEGWNERFGLPVDDASIGYGHSSEEVASVRVESPDLLTAYHDAVHARTVEFLKGVDEPALDRVVDDSWDPPVTLGVRLVSVVNDDLQHVGQAAYVRGLVERR